MEDGPASGIIVRSLGSSEIELYINRARLYRLIFPGVAEINGISAIAEDSSVLSARVRNSLLRRTSRRSRPVKLASRKG